MKSIEQFPDFSDSRPAPDHIPFRASRLFGRFGVRVADFASVFGVDLRSLALFRMAISAVLLTDLAVRVQSLRAHYTDEGILPRTVDIEQLLNPANFSLHLMSGSVFFEGLLFFCAAFFLILLFVGYRTRLATFVSWIFLISLQNRNPIILQGGDIFVRALLFWALFLPLGARFSIDSFSSKNPEPLAPAGKNPNQFLSMATAAILLQVALVYWSTVLLKSGREWYPNWTAVYYALHIDQFAKPFGIWLRQYYSLTRFLACSTFYWEMIGPLLLFVPVAFVPLRLIGILGFVGMHIGFFTSMELGVFPFVSSAAMIPFIPAWVWDVPLAALRRKAWVGALVERVSGFFARVAAMLPRLERPRLSTPIWANLVVGALFVYVVILNASSVPRFNIHLPPNFDTVAEFLKIDQVWDMFAPYPMRDDGWYVIPGKLEDGKIVDVYHFKEEAPSWEKPAVISATYQDDRWRSFMMSLWLEEYDAHREAYGEYLCRTWNANRPPGKRLASFEIIYMLKMVLPDYKKPNLEKTPIWKHECL